MVAASSSTGVASDTPVTSILALKPTIKTKIRINGSEKKNLKSRLHHLLK